MSAQIKAVGIVKSWFGGKPLIDVDAGNIVRETIKALNIPSEIVALVLVDNVQQ